MFSGGAIGPPGTGWNYGGTFDRTPVFLGCSDQDAHVPASRVRETADVFARMGADVTLRIYPAMGHLVNDDETAFAQRLLDAVTARISQHTALRTASAGTDAPRWLARRCRCWDELRFRVWALTLPGCWDSVEGDEKWRMKRR